MSERFRRFCLAVGVIAALATAALLVSVGCAARVCAGAAAPLDPADAPVADVILVPATGDYGTVSPKMRARLETALALYGAGKAPVVVVTGRDLEADVMADWLGGRGVPAGAIRLDRGGLDFYDTFARAAAAYPGARVLFCVEALHAARAEYLARALGVDAVFVSCETVPSRGDFVQRAREHFAATKAVLEAELLRRPSVRTLDVQPYATAD